MSRTAKSTWVKLAPKRSRSVSEPRRRGASRAVSRPVASASLNSAIGPSSRRAAASDSPASRGSFVASAVASCSSAAPSPAKTVWAARRTSSAGSGGKNSDVTASATPPPINPSKIRLSWKPSLPEGSSETIRIADTAASAVSSSPPPSSTAVLIASTTISPICSDPVPISATIADATLIPSTTPATSCSAFDPRCPYDAPRQITAAIEANDGRPSSSSSTAAYQAMVAAAAV